MHRHEIIISESAVSDLRDFFKSLTEENIFEFFDVVVFQRGVEYYETGSISEIFFISLIKKNLEFTGNMYYDKIANVLSHLRIINKSRTSEIVHEIRQKYRLRRNLMKQLDRL